MRAEPGDRTGVFGRGIGAGVLGGVTVGGLVGTAALPVIGTFFGLLYGAVVGLVMGIGTGGVLALAAPGLPDRPGLLRMAGAAGATVTALAFVLVFHPAAPLVLGWLPVCALTGLLVGPWVLRGPAARQFPLAPRPGPGGRRWDGLSAARVVAVGSALGAGLGATVGTGIGVVSDPARLIGAAAAEGAVLGSACGLLLALLVAGARQLVETGRRYRERSWSR